MIDMRCPQCRLVWQEDRSEGDSPSSPHLLICPRCGGLGERREEQEKPA